MIFVMVPRFQEKISKLPTVGVSHFTECIGPAGKSVDAEVCTEQAARRQVPFVPATMQEQSDKTADLTDLRH